MSMSINFKDVYSPNLMTKLTGIYLTNSICIDLYDLIGKLPKKKLIQIHFLVLNKIIRLKSLKTCKLSFKTVIHRYILQKGFLT